MVYRFWTIRKLSLQILFEINVFEDLLTKEKNINFSANKITKNIREM